MMNLLSTKFSILWFIFIFSILLIWKSYPTMKELRKFSSDKCLDIIPNEVLIDIYGSNMKNQYHLFIRRSPEVQILFDQALLHIYGFNMVEANRNLKAAIYMDHLCAMCYWALSYTFSPFLNEGVNPEQVIISRNAINSAINIITLYPNNFTDIEKDLINAQNYRVALNVEEWKNKTQNYYDVQYSMKMKVLADKYPNNSDILCCYADAVLNLSPWNYYESDQITIKEFIQPVYNAIEKALQLTNYQHPFALHLWIHIAEPNKNPLFGVIAADNLASLVSNEGSSHLIHMPGHIFMRVGRYDDCIQSGIKTITLDKYYESKCLHPYLTSHNSALLVMATLNNGRIITALKYSYSIDYTHDSYATLITGLFPTPKELVYVRYGRWNEVIKSLNENQFKGSIDRELLRGNEKIYQKPVFLQVIRQYTSFIAQLR